MPQQLNKQTAADTAQIRRLEEQSGVDLRQCYQCGTCTAGCPLAQYMDMTPRQVLRHLQLGFLAEALHSNAPWICAACHSCSARCPHNIQVCELMEAVRRMAASRGIYPLRRARIFTRAFLAPVKLFGRSHEMSMTALYNIASGRIWQHFEYLPAMLKGRKLRLLPAQVRDKRALRRIFANCAKEEAE